MKQNVTHNVQSENDIEAAPWSWNVGSHACRTADRDKKTTAKYNSTHASHFQLLATKYILHNSYQT